MKNQLKKIRLSKKLSQEELGELVGAEKSQISKLESGKTKLHSGWIEKLSIVLNVSPADILGEDMDLSFLVYQAPLISFVQAGDFTGVFDPYEKGDYAELVNTAHDKRTVIALKVSGDSMDRFAPDGATIIVDYADKELVDGRLYVIRLNGDNETTFKKYRAAPPRLEPYSTGEYETIFPKGDMEVVGRVVEATIKAP